MFLISRGHLAHTDKSVIFLNVPVQRNTVSQPPGASFALANLNSWAKQVCIIPYFSVRVFSV